MCRFESKCYTREVLVQFTSIEEANDKCSRELSCESFRQKSHELKISVSGTKGQMTLGDIFGGQTQMKLYA